MATPASATEPSRTWHASDLKRLEGKVVVVSGATSGIGLATAEGFARLGASVRLLVRSEERGAQACAAIVERTRNSDVQVSVFDLSNLSPREAGPSFKRARVASRHAREDPRIDDPE